MPSPCRSPVSRKIAAASWCAVIASSNRRTSRSAMPRLFSAIAFAVPVAGLPEDRGRVLARGDRLLEPPHLPQREAEVVQRRGLVVPGRPDGGRHRG